LTPSLATRFQHVTEDPRKHHARLKPAAYGVAAGVVLAVVVALVLLFLFARGSTPALSEESLRAAIERWEAHGPKSYRLELMVSGTRSGPVELEVRDEEPVRLVRDGRTPARHTWDFWTVQGQLEAMHTELTGDPQTLFGVQDRSQVILRAEFDPELGYPLRYQRQVLGKRVEIGWELVRFEPLD
jgi:hypothetical protein